MLRRVVARLLALCLALGAGAPNALATPYAGPVETCEAGPGASPIAAGGERGLRVPAGTLPTMPPGRYDFAVNVGPVAQSSSRIGAEVPPTLGSEAVWACDGSGSVSPATSYLFHLCDVESTVGTKVYLSTVFIDREPREAGRFAYTIHEPGTYYLYCTVGHADGTSSTERVRFEVPEADGVPTVSSRVAEIVGECRSALGPDAGEYEVALWLHDWVTHHSRFDSTRCHHGADSILFMGLGVCDSYSKLYKMLLAEAGMDCERQTGTGNGDGHAWDVACIDGAWCQIDPTWDDRVFGDDDPLVSGAEGHDYFGLTDELMMLDHAYEVIHPCTTMANSHAFVNETYRTWLSHIWDDFGDRLDSGSLSFEVPNGGVVMTGGGGSFSGRGYVDRCSAVAAACMSEIGWTMLTHPVDASFSYDPSSQSLRCRVDLGSASLVLPGNAREVGASAFAGDGGLVTVEVRDGTAVIGDEAFAHCDGLFWVSVPASVTQLGSDVFGGLDRGRFMVVCEEGSAAEAYCEANGIVACTG